MSLVLQSPAARWILVGFVLVGGATALVISLGAQDEVRRLLEWTDAQGAAAPLVFVVVMALVVFFVLPGVIFTTGAGFVFGVVAGTACVVVGTTLGAALAFLAARYAFGSRAREFVLSRARLRVVGDALGRHGWKVVLLTRLIPFFPGKLSNYFFGVTPVSLSGFVGGTFLGVIPFSLHNVYLGSIAADVATAGSGRGPESLIEWVFYGAGFLATAVAALYLARRAMRALARYEREGGGDRRCRG